MNRPFRHLRRSSLPIWIITLLLIVSLGGVIGGIFYSVRMEVTYRSRLVPGEAGIVRCAVNRLPLQVFRPGEPVSIELAGGRDLAGVLRSAAAGPEQVELELEVAGAPDYPAEAAITLRSQRLLAAFLSAAPARLSPPPAGPAAEELGDGL